MSYRNAKVYHDGTHYIAIPYEPRPMKRVCGGKVTQTPEEKTENEKSATAYKKEFERLYKKYSDLPKKARKEKVIEEINKDINNENQAAAIVEENIERVKKNTMTRKTRLFRKVMLQDWNYFCTFTYDDKKHTEISFRKSLSNCLRHLSSRKGWKYIGVWERSPENNRLHFHGIFHIPEMIGELIEVSDYSTKTKRMQKSYQNTHFNERYGRSDFKSICKFEFAQAVRYLLKYIEKSGERLVYSRGLPTYFHTDVMPDDVICRCGIEDRKLLLFDNFACWIKGEYIGQVCPEVISQLPKSN